jgi:hypothetical protein
MTAVKDLSVDQLKPMREAEVRLILDDYRENHEALVSRRYLNSIQDARQEYGSGETTRLRGLRSS